MSLRGSGTENRPSRTAHSTAGGTSFPGRGAAGKAKVIVLAVAAVLLAMVALVKFSMDMSKPLPTGGEQPIRANAEGQGKGKGQGQPQDQAKPEESENTSPPPAPGLLSG
jgi:hypothetical protein